MKYIYEKWPPPRNLNFSTIYILQQLNCCPSKNSFANAGKKLRTMRAETDSISVCPMELGKSPTGSNEYICINIPCAYRRNSKCRMMKNKKRYPLGSDVDEGGNFLPSINSPTNVIYHHGEPFLSMARKIYAIMEVMGANSTGFVTLHNL